MAGKVALFFLIGVAAVSYVSAVDLLVGSQDGGTLVYECVKKGTFLSAITTPERIEVEADENRIIHRVNVTDERPDKLGYARIVEGGPGMKEVVIEVGRHGAFRQYAFNVQVFAIESDAPVTSTDQYTTESFTTTDKGDIITTTEI